VLINELAHALVRADKRDGDPAPLNYAAEELVAETVASMVADTLGLDTSGSSVPYLATWAQSTETATLEATATLIDRLARRIEDAVLTVEQEAAA
jgi:antirestriction protein ArdC